MPELSSPSSPLPPWRQPLSRALHRNRSQPFARYFQLATLRLDGRPANRTVVFRGFVEAEATLRAAAQTSTQGHSLKLVTDRRSEKIAQLSQSAWAEACWYFPKTREQFRLAGQLYAIPSTSPLHRQSWQALSTAAQKQFGWPDPGKPRAEATAFDPEVDPERPPDTFAVLLLTPDWVDHLELRGDPQQRSQYTWQDNQWHLKAVNP